MEKVQIEVPSFIRVEVQNLCLPRGAGPLDPPQIRPLCKHQCIDECGPDCIVRSMQSTGLLFSSLLLPCSLSGAGQKVALSPAPTLPPAIPRTVKIKLCSCRKVAPYLDVLKRAELVAIVENVIVTQFWMGSMDVV